MILWVRWERWRGGVHLFRYANVNGDNDTNVLSIINRANFQQNQNIGIGILGVSKMKLWQSTITLYVCMYVYCSELMNLRALTLINVIQCEDASSFHTTWKVNKHPLINSFVGSSENSIFMCIENYYGKLTVRHDTLELFLSWLLDVKHIIACFHLPLYYSRIYGFFRGLMDKPTMNNNNNNNKNRLSM